MDKKTILKWEIFSAIFIIFFGTLFHFVFDWLGQNPIVGIFSPVNESVWEHTKLAFWPLLFFSLVEIYFLRNIYKKFIAVKAIESCLVIFLIIALFYTYSGILGFNLLPVDIGTFFFAVIFGQIFSYRSIISETDKKSSIFISLVILFLLVFLFVLYTFNPPKIALFFDPQGFGYGIDWLQSVK